MPREDLLQLRETLKDLYWEMRTAAMNREIYGQRLKIVRSQNFWLEFLIALGTSTALASWAIWKTGPLEYVWVGLNSVAVVLAIAKSFLTLPKKIERYSKLFTGYGDVLFDLERIVRDVKINGGLVPDYNERYQDALNRVQKLVVDDDPKPNKKLVDRCFDTINARYPADSLWLP